MANAALKAIIGADASPFVSAMKTVEAVSTQAGTQTATALRQAEKALIDASSSAELTVRQTNFYAQALADVRRQLAEVTAAENAATLATNKSAEARAMAARRDPSQFTPGPTGSEVPRATNNATRIAELRSEYEEKKRRQLLDKERAGMLTGSEVPRTVHGADKVAQLRAAWDAGDRSPELRAEIRSLAAARNRAASAPTSYRDSTSPDGKSGARIEGLGKMLGSGQMQIAHSLRAAFDSLASGANPFRVLLQQLPQVLQGLTLMGVSFRSIIGFVGPIGIIAAAVGGLGVALSKISMNLAGENETAKMAVHWLEVQRQRLHQLVEERQREIALAKEKNDLMREEAKATNRRGDELGRERVETRVLEAKTPEEGRKIKEDYLKDQVTVTRMAHETTKHNLYNRSDPEAQKTADENAIAYEKAKQALLQFQKEGDNKSPKVSSEERKSGGGFNNQLTSNQRIGAYVAGPNLDMSKQILSAHHKTNALLTKIAAKSGGKTGSGGHGSVGGLSTG